MNTASNTVTKAFMGTFTFRIGDFERKLNAIFIVPEQSEESPEMVFEKSLKDEFGYSSNDHENGAFYCDGDALCRPERVDPLTQDMYDYLRNIGFSQLN